MDVLNLSIGGPDYLDLPFVEKVRLILPAYFRFFLFDIIHMMILFAT